jgi:hypothetical protein
MVCLSGKHCPNALKKRKRVQNVWVMYWRDLGGGRQRECSHQRGTFTNDQSKEGYEKAFASGSQIKLLLPLLGETGCRLAEIVGLRLQDIDLENDNQKTQLATQKQAA